MRMKSVLFHKFLKYQLLRQIHLVRNSSFESKKVVFIGNDDFSIPSLETMRKILPAASLSVVVSNKKNLVGQHAEKNHLKLIEWRDFLRCCEVLEDKSHYDIGVVASFGHLVPEFVIRRFKQGILNVHGSILPRLRGAAPISHALFNDDSHTGVSIMIIAPNRFDVGPVLHTKEVPIPRHIRAGELRVLLADLGSEALEEVLVDLEQFLKNSIPQKETESTLAPRLTHQMAQVNWDAKNDAIYNLFRGFGGTSKFLWTHYEGRKVDLDEIGIVEIEPSPLPVLSKSSKEENLEKLDWFTKFETFYPSPPSRIVRMKKEENEGVLSGEIKLKEKNLLCVKCGCVPESWIFVQKLKIGKKWMNGKDFFNGFLSSKRSKHHFQYLKETLMSDENKIKLKS